MTVFGAEINGRGIGAFNAENEIHAEERAASKPFQADLTVLENEGRPLWNGTDVLKEIAPAVNRVAFLFNPATAPWTEYLNVFKAAAPSFGVEAIAAPVHDTSELESVIAAQAREPNGGLIVVPDAFLITYRAEVTSLAARYRVPAVYPFRYFTELGGLLSYGSDQLDNYRRAAGYADKILNGVKPSELPVQCRSNSRR